LSTQPVEGGLVIGFTMNCIVFDKPAYRIRQAVNEKFYKPLRLVKNAALQHFFLMLLNSLMFGVNS
jgi:hypothetical protein